MSQPSQKEYYHGDRLNVDRARQRFERADPTIAANLLKVLEEADDRLRTSRPDSGTLSNLLQLYAQLIKLTSNIIAIRNGLASPSSTVDATLFSDFMKTVRDFDHLLGDLDYTLIALYNPELARSVLAALDYDRDIFHTYNREIAPKFGLQPEDAPASLMHYLQQWSTEMGYENKDLLYLDIELTGQQFETDSRPLSAKSISNIHAFCDVLVECKNKLAGIITTNWSIKEVFESNNRKIEIIMGDKFENISNSTIINRSAVENAFNTVKKQHGADTAEVLRTIAALVEKSGNKEAAELYDSFNEEIAKPAPKKSVLKSMWEGLKAALPVLTSVAGITEQVVKIIGS